MNKKKIRIFTPSWADESNTNAQNLTVKSIVARLDSEIFHITMLYQENIDARLKGKPNITFISWKKHGNAIRILMHMILNSYDIFFYPRYTVIEKGFLWLNYLRRGQTKLITHVVHRIDPAIFRNRSFSAGVCKKLIQYSTIVLGNSQFVTQTTIDNFKVQAETIHNGIDRRFFYPAVLENKDEEGNIRVFYAGSFQARKRPALIVDLAKKFPRVRFDLAGSGPELESCQQLVADLGINNVNFLGHLKPVDLGEQMRTADIFLFPSLIEGHPQVLGQAAACGLPCIAMAVYRPDYIAHEKTGFLAEDDQALEDYLKRLIASEPLRHTMGKAAAVHARQFDWDIVVKRWSEVFKKVTNN